MEKIATVNEISVGGMKSFFFRDKEILIVNVNGEFYALDNRCSHMGGNLSEGTLEGDVIVCPKHGSRFNVKSGEAIQGPKILVIRFSTKNLNTYPIKINGNDILIEA